MCTAMLSPIGSMIAGGSKKQMLGAAVGGLAGSLLTGKKKKKPDGPEVIEERPRGY
jgi:hypothetical protein